MAVDETTPLVGHSGASAMDESLKHRHSKATSTAWLLMVLIFFANGSGDLQRAPWQRMLESIFCKEYYSGTSPKLVLGEIPEADCKLPPIQGQVAELVGWDALFTFVPGLLLTIPYGALCDRWGRKPILLLSASGIFLGQLWMFFSAFLAQRGLMDVRFSLFSNLINMIGGGSSVISMTMYSMIADCTTGADRSRFFFRFMGIGISSNLVATPIASLVMRKSVWLALQCSTASLLAAVVLAACLPETLKFRQEAIADALIDQVAGETPAEATTDDRASLLSTGDLSHAKVETYVARVMQSVSAYAFVFKSPVLVSLTATFLVHSLGMVSMEFLLNLASNRFKWTFAEANFLRPVASITTLVLLVQLLPLVNALLQERFGLSPARANLFIARGTVLSATIGFIGIAIAPTPVIIIPAIMFYAFGAGFSPAVRDLATVVSAPEVVAKMYSVFQTVDAVGGMIGGTVMGKSFVLGMEWGGLWTGLPFMIAGVLYLGVALVIWLVRIPEATPDVDDDVDR